MTVSSLSSNSVNSKAIFPLKEETFLLCTRAFDMFFPTSLTKMAKSEFNSLCHKWAYIVFQLNCENRNFNDFVCVELFVKRALLSLSPTCTLQTDNYLTLYEILNISLGLYNNNNTIVSVISSPANDQFIVFMCKCLSSCVIRSINECNEVYLLVEKTINLEKWWLLMKPLILIWSKVILSFPVECWISESLWILSSISSTFNIPHMDTAPDTCLAIPFDAFLTAKFKDSLKLATYSHLVLSIYEKKVY